VKVGDLVRFVPGTQLYLHFSEERWMTTGTIGMITEMEIDGTEPMFLVVGVDKYCNYWFYEDELELVSPVRN